MTGALAPQSRLLNKPIASHAMAIPQLRAVDADDLDQLLAVYSDAVTSQAGPFYQQAQIKAWSAHPYATEAVAEALRRGRALASCASGDPATIEAFALLDPIDRLSLLYCRGRSSRQGRATALVQAVEELARQQGCQQLRTEASQLSRPLLLRQGWQLQAEERVQFAGVSFLRWRMIKSLDNQAHG